MPRVICTKPTSHKSTPSEWRLVVKGGAMELVMAWRFPALKTYPSVIPVSCLFLIDVCSYFVWWVPTCQYCYSFFGVDHTRSTECHPIPLFVCLIGFNPGYSSEYGKTKKQTKRLVWSWDPPVVDTLGITTKKTCLPKSGFSAFKDTVLVFWGYTQWYMNSHAISSIFQDYTLRFATAPPVQTTLPEKFSMPCFKELIAVLSENPGISWKEISQVL